MTQLLDYQNEKTLQRKQIITCYLAEASTLLLIVILSNFLLAFNDQFILGLTKKFSRYIYFRKNLTDSIKKYD